MGLTWAALRARAVVAMYVAAFAQLGVLTRAYLDKLFQVRLSARSWLGRKITG